MSQLDDEQVSLLEQIINQYITEHFSDFKENLLENNNSFIFLEKGSLNLLLSYLLLMTKNTTNPIQKEVFEASKLLAQLDDLINDNKKEFEELIDLFRNIT